jgi:protein TonB
MIKKTTGFFIFVLVVLLHGLLLSTLIRTSQTITPPQAQFSEPSISGALIAPSPSTNNTPKPAPEAKPHVKQAAHTRTQHTPSSNQTAALPKPEKNNIHEPSQEATQSPAAPTPNKESPATSSREDNTPPSAPNPAPTADRNKAKPEEATFTPPRTDAEHLNNPAPVYPAISRRMGEQGKVLIDVHILPNGSVEQLKIRTSSGYPRLDEAALKAVKQWKYVPAKRGDQAIAFWYIQPISFVLNSN